MPEAKSYACPKCGKAMVFSLSESGATESVYNCSDANCPKVLKVNTAAGNAMSTAEILANIAGAAGAIAVTALWVGKHVLHFSVTGRPAPGG